MADLGITQADFNRLRLGSAVASGTGTEPDTLLGRAFSTVTSLFTTPEEAAASVRTGIHDAIPTEIAALPYAQAIEDSIVNHVLSAEFRGLDYDLEDFEAHIESTVAQAFSAHIQAAPAATRVATLTQSLTELGAAVGEPQQAQINSAVTAIRGLDPQLQAALTNAVAQNPNFVEYILEKMGNEDAEGGLTAMLEDLDPQAVGPLTGILNNIANHPEMEMDALDNVIDTVTAHTDLMQQRDAAVAAEASNEELAEIDRQIEIATTEMYRAIREAGGNLPALAGMNSTMMMAFMMDLVNGTGTDGAIANLGAALNLSPEQLEAMQELIGPFAGIIEFMVEPYAALYQEHGLAITEAFGRTQDRIGTLTDPDQIEYTGPDGATTPEVTISFSAPATVGTIDVADFGDSFTEAMEGRSYEDVLDIVDAMEAANRDFSDEADLLRDALENGIITQVQLREAFGISASDLAPAAAEVEAGVEAFVRRAGTAPSLQATVGGP